MSNHLHTDLPPLTLSYMGANFVARELGYGAADEWGPFDAATMSGVFPRRSRASSGAPAMSRASTASA